MVKMLLSALIVGLLMPAGFVHADDPKVVLSKAIKAYGGAEKLAKLNAVRARARGTVNVGADAPFTLDTIWQGPDHLKNTVKLEGPKQTISLTEVIAGGDSWSSRDGKAGRLSSDKQDELRAGACPPHPPVDAVAAR